MKKNMLFEYDLMQEETFFDTASLSSVTVVIMSELKQAVDDTVEMNASS